MSVRARRRRAFLMLSLALACGGLAASEVGGRIRAVERRVGAQVPIVVATRSLPAEAEVQRDDLAVREMPERYVPPGALSSPAQAAGARTAVPLASGSPLTHGQLGGGRGGAPGNRGTAALRRGERAVEVGVAGGATLGDAAGPGARVDVLVSTEPREGPGRSFLALEDVELLGLRGGDGAAAAPAREDAGGVAATTAVARLRVTLRQAVYLTAAQNFAREVRLLPRPVGDSRRAGRTVVGAGGL
ncbi:MAG: Flp pilus assembly protein CpaB [Thermoleophilaceae bacterium]